MHKPFGKTQLKSLKHRDKDNIVAKELEIFLLDIEDPVNIGSIVRTADGLGLDNLVLSEISYDKLSKGIELTSMGLHRRFEFIQVENIVDYLETKRNDGFQLVGLDITTNSICYKDFKYSSKVVLILGNEKLGIYKKYLDLIDNFIHIPMLGKGDSLNVNVAFAVASYEIILQKQIT